MTSVVLIAEDNSQVAVSDVIEFTDLVFGHGYRPQTGTIADNYAALYTGGSAPTANPNQPVFLGNLQDPASAASTALRAALAPAGGGRPGNSVVWLGDSLTQWQDAVAASNAPGSSVSHSQRVSLGNLGSIVSGQQALYVTNAGVGGNKTADMLARFDTDVTPYAPNAVHILGGINDLGASVPIATIIANLQALVAKVRAIGAAPIMGLLPPNNTAGDHAGITALNTWITRWAATQGIAVVDYHTPLVDPATGNYLATYLRDGTHPTDAGFLLMAQTFAKVAAAVLPSGGPKLPSDNTSVSNLIANGLFINSGSGFPSSWSGGTGTGITTSLVTGDTAILGSWVQVAAAASAGNAQLFQNIATAPVAGHRYALLGKIKTSWTSGANGFQIRNRVTLGDTSTVDMMPLNNVAVSLATPGVFYCEYTCPANAASQQVSLICAAGTMTLNVAQIGLYDLTAMGVA